MKYTPEQFVRDWMAGVPIAEMAERSGRQSKHIIATAHHMRKCGVHLPNRRRGTGFVVAKLNAIIDGAVK